MLRVSPCKGCTKRSSACHSTCKDYHDWCREAKEYKDMIAKAKKEEQDVMECVIAARRKRKPRKRDRRAPE